MTCPAQIIDGASTVLLDFDGPVCAVFDGLSNHQVATELRDLFEGELPDAVDQSRDPFDVLKYAASLGDFAGLVERRLRELEIRAVALAPATPGTSEVLKALHARGKLVVVVSNNSEDAIAAYLNTRGLAKLVVGISARTSPDIQKLKPHPYLLQQAMDLVGASPKHSVMIGDSVTDIEAAHRANVSTIAYANKPGKRTKFERCGASVIIDHMNDLVR
ncbi:HAD-IIIA family hydrolase [Saccharopolyspora sp. K220]|uniref:HAD family hydrolase n=1 Tax=Saccharopolyspora soli TaxID=2926618 RepID=UPI001F596AD2|nr:HAD-IIIA family hydrolase [Saccharopolyspora soli]MCI2416312.1 HAD-IIIA family hydrolase [Saccharopolyspora soli]